MANREGHIAGAERRAGVVTQAELDAKMSVKRELFRFIQTECGIYLCSYDNTTVSAR